MLMEFIFALSMQISNITLEDENIRSDYLQNIVFDTRFFINYVRLKCDPIAL